MATGGVRRRKTPPVRRQRLNPAVVIAAARRLLDEEGRGALTMARLGEILGVTPMAIYRHVADRDALVRGATQTVLAELAAAAHETSDWSAGVAGWMQELRRRWLAHPWLESFLGTPVEESEPWLALTDQLAQLLGQAGLAPRQVARELMLITRSTVGVLAGEAASRLTDRGAFGTAMLESLDAAGRRRWQPVAKALTKYSNDQLFADLISSTLTRVASQAQ